MSKPAPASSQEAKRATRVYLKTLGCRLNEAEIVTWDRDFRRSGYQLVDAPGEADLIVLNTCAVTTEAARKSRKLAGSLHRKNPQAKLVLSGCMAELEPERAGALAGVDLVIDNHDKDTLVARIDEVLKMPTMPVAAMDAESSFADATTTDKAPQSPLGLVQLGARARRTRAFIKVQDGCRNKCSYCVVTIARGDERSRSIEELTSEIQSLADAGVVEAVLTGVHLGGYGHDLGLSLFELVRAVLKRTSISRLRLSSLEPWDLPDNFAELWQDSRLLPHLHLPLQSGSDSVLRRMARRCFRKDYRALLARMRAVPNMNITTDLIVGFPQESDREFRESYDFCQEMMFGDMHIFAFSPREGTRAATMPGRLPGPTLRERSREIHRLSSSMRAHQMQKVSGQSRRVLWEQARRDESGGLRATGHTEDYWKVIAYDSDVRPGTCSEVTLQFRGETAESTAHLEAHPKPTQN